MIPTKKTWLLLGAAIAVGAANLIPGGTRAAAELPGLVELGVDDVTRIEITQGAKPKVTLTLEDGDWQLVSPVKGPADTPGIRRLIRLFDDGIPMDARIDEANPEPYGLDFQDAAAVDLYTGGEVATVSFVIGWDTSGGSSFVRLHEDDTVYRAKIGGRARWDREVDLWRDPFVVREDKASVTDIQVAVGDERFTFASDGGVTGGRQRRWSLVEDPGFPLDQRTVEAWASSLMALRAGEVLSSEFDGGFDEPAAVVTLQLEGGESVELTFGSREGDRSAFVKRSDRQAAYRISPTHRTRAARALADYSDATALSFDRDQVKQLRLEDDGVTVVLEQQAEAGDWIVREPANVDVDLKLVYFTVNNLGDLRSDETVQVTLDEAGLLEPWMTVTIQMMDGSSSVLEVGHELDDPSNPRSYARLAGTDRVFTLRQQTITRIRQGFGRSQ